MTADMRNAIYHQMDFGQLALQKLGQTDPNFRLYLAGIKPEPPKEWTHMEVVGAVYREPKTGPNKGTLSLMVPGTRKSVKLSRSELDAYRASQEPGTSKNDSK